MPRFKITVDTGFPGCDHIDEADFDDDEWAAMTEEQRENALHEARCQAVWNFIDVWSEEITEGE